MEVGNAENPLGNIDGFVPRVFMLPVRAARGRSIVSKSEVRWWIKTYEHTTQCEKGEECDFPKCAEMKNNIEHTKSCQRVDRTTGVCLNCVSPMFLLMLRSANKLLEIEKQPLIQIEGLPADVPHPLQPRVRQLQQIAARLNNRGLVRSILVSQEVNDQGRMVLRARVRAPNAAARRERNEGQDEGLEQENEEQDERNERENEVRGQEDEGQDEGLEQDDDGQDDQ